LEYADHLLYILYDNERTIRVWDMDHSTLLAEWHFAWLNKQVPPLPSCARARPRASSAAATKHARRLALSPNP
jgi:hypothetical protein